MKHLIRFLPLVLLVITSLVIFAKFYFKGALPFPGNLLVTFYFPWNGGGYSGFDPWTTRKDVIAMDVIRQMYPWRRLAFDVIKSGQWPFWNPYNFSGTPLLANLQSSIFFPGNFVWLFLPHVWAWVSQVILLPLIFGLFCYLFFRSLKLSQLSATFGAIVVSNLSYVVVWAEQLVVIQSAMFLPLVLWGIGKYSETKRFIYLWLVPLFLAFSIFGGHIQTVAYIYIITGFYFMFKKVPVKYIILVLVLSFGLSAIQLVPSAELYVNSARETKASKELFYQSTFPWQNLVTIFAPDFYGNPATGNFRGRDYGNFQGYFGIVALVLAGTAVIKSRQEKEIKFWGLLAAAGLAFSLPPLAYLFEIFQIPILSSGYPSRMIFIFQFAMGVLSVYGFEYFISRR